MKKIFLFLITSLLGLNLCGCSTKTAENGNSKILINDVDFTYTYSKIKFDFRPDQRVKSYNAYFSENGKTQNLITNVVSQKEYSLSFLGDSDYNVLFKAFAGPGYIDSDMKIIGEVHHFKVEKDVGNISLSAYVTESYSIKINVSNKDENDKTPITVKVKKGFETVKNFEHISEPSDLETEADLPAGNYKITAFFEKTEDSLQSSSLNLDSDLIIPRRQSVLNDFKAELINDNVVLTWNQSSSGNLDRKLTVTCGSSKEEFINYYNGKNLKPGVAIPANSFGVGNLLLSFTLQLVPNQYEETFLASEIVSAKTTVNILKHNTPVISAVFQENGNVMIGCSNSEEGKYKLQVVSESGQEVENRIFFNGSVSSFPISTKKAGEKWGIGNFQIKLTKLASNNNELDSESGTTSVTTQKISLVPDVRFKISENKIAVDVAPFSTIFNNLCNEKDFFITASLLRTTDKEIQDEVSIPAAGSHEFILDDLPDGKYHVSCSFSDVTQEAIGNTGFVYSKKDSESVNKLTPPATTEVDNLISNMKVERTGSVGQGCEYRIYVDLLPSDYENIVLVSVNCSYFCYASGTPSSALPGACQWISGTCSATSNFQSVTGNSKKKYVTVVATKPSNRYLYGEKPLRFSIKVGKGSLEQTLSLERAE